MQQELLYTRDGSFHLTPDPEYPDSLVLTTAQGYYVLEDIGPDSPVYRYASMPIMSASSLIQRRPRYASITPVTLTNLKSAL